MGLIELKMVNTFLICSSYLESARQLDKRRLANQRREALQILFNILKLKIVAKFMADSIPSDPYQFHFWIRDLIRRYKRKDYYISLRMRNSNPGMNPQPLTGTVSQILDPTYQPNWILTPKTSLVIDQCLIVISETNQEIFKVDRFREGDKPITFGFIYHPAVLMWLGHEDSLREYIDAHIQASIERGINNQMPRNSLYGASSPKWTSDSDFHIRHKSNLLAKELDRREPVWYQNLPSFKLVPTNLDYFWPYTPKMTSSKGIADSNFRYRITLVTFENFQIKIV